MNDILFKSDLYKKTVNDLIESYSEHIKWNKNFVTYTKEDLIQYILTYAAEKNFIIKDRGVLEIAKDNYGFIRSFENSYNISKNNSYVQSSKIKKYRLRIGDYIEGSISFCTKQRKSVLQSLDFINNQAVNSEKRHLVFYDLTSDFPRQRINIERSDSITSRLVDLFVPIGLGQRALIVAPPKTGKSTLLYDLCRSFIQSNTKIDSIFFLMIGERPEEADQAKIHLSQNAHVVYSTFDDIPSRQIQVADMTISHARKLAETGKNVAVFVDSLTRLVRAYNQHVPHSGKVLSGGIDYAALQKGKEFFGTARNIMEGGSITMICTCLVDTGSRMDEVIFEEFKGTGNAEIHLSRKASERRVFPAISIAKSGTRRSDYMMTLQNNTCTELIRRTVTSLDDVDALLLVMKKMKATATNKQLLDNVMHVSDSMSSKD